MNPKWDRILADGLVLTLTIIGIIFGMLVPMLVRSREFTITTDKITVYSAAEHPRIFWWVVAVCLILSISCAVCAFLRALRLKRREEQV